MSQCIFRIESYSLGPASQFPPLHDWWRNAIETQLPEDFDRSLLVIPFAHDWGACMGGYSWVFMGRKEQFRVHDAITEGTAWSVMGDLNSRCKSISVLQLWNAELTIVLFT